MSINYFLNISLWSNVCDTKWRTVKGSGLFLVPGSQMAADGECERDMEHRMNEGYRAMGSAEKCAEQ